MTTIQQSADNIPHNNYETFISASVCLRRKNSPAEVLTRFTHTALTTSASDQTQSDSDINTSAYNDSEEVPVSNTLVRTAKLQSF